MADKRNQVAQLEVKVDGSQPKSELAGISDAAIAMGREVGEAGRSAGEGLDSGIGKGADSAVKRIDSATKSIITAIKRSTSDSQKGLSAISTADSGGVGSAAFYEDYAARKGISAAGIKPYIDILRSVRNELELTEAREREFAASSAFEQKTVDAAKLAKSIDYVRWWRNELELTEAQQKKMASSYVDLGIRGSSDIVKDAQAVRAALNQIRSSGTESDYSRAKLAAAERMAALRSEYDGAKKSLTEFGMTARETAYMLRLVPAQMTDIAVSLAGGQSPMMVLLQQGGQLKDMFGGAGNAAKAIGGYVLSMVNPLTIGAAAAGALALAFYQGQEAVKELENQISLAGKSAYLSAGEIASAAEGIGTKIGASTSSVIAAMTEIATKSDIPKSALAGVTEAAVRLERAGGQAASETAKQFAELAKDPVNAIKKLNEETGFLTAETYKQIQSLIDQGDQEAASALAMKTYGEALNKRTAEVEKNVGIMGQAWKGLAKIVSDTWSEMSKSFANDAQGRLDGARYGISQARGRGAFISGDDEQKQLAPLIAAAEAEKKANSEKEKSVALEKSKIAWAGEVHETRSKEIKLAERLNQIEKEGLKVGASRAEIDQLKAAAKEKIMGKGGSSSKSGKTEEEKQKEDQDALIKQATELLNLTNARGEAERKLTAAESFQVKLKDSSVYQNAKPEIKAALDAIVSEAIEREKINQSIEDEEARHNSRMKALSKVDDRLEEERRVSAEQLERLMQEGKLALMSERERSIAQAMYSLEDKADKQRKEIIRSVEDETDRKQKLAEVEADLAIQKAKVTAAMGRNIDSQRTFENGWNKAFQSYLVDATNYSKQAETIFKSAADSMADITTKLVMGQKVSWTDMANTFIAQIIRMKMQAAAAEVVSSIGSLFGVGGTSFSGTSVSASAVQAGGITSVSDLLSSVPTIAFAKGAAFYEPSIHAYVNQVIDQPTPFSFGRTAFANGGVFGEAGPEAVMPLTRDNSGSLGVKAQIGQSAPNISFNIENKSGQDVSAKQSSAPSFDGKSYVLNIVLEAASTNPSFRQAMGVPA